MKKIVINTLISLFLIISIFLLIYTHYKSSIVFDGKRISNYFIYYIISSLGILFFSILFFLKRSFKENILVSLVTFIILIYIAEFLFLFSKNETLTDIQINEKRRLEKAKIVLEKYNLEIDTRSKLEFQRDEKMKGNDLSLVITPFRMLHLEGLENYSWKEDSNKPKRILPLAGVSKKLTIGGSETGKYNIYQSDRFGFNNPDSEWDEINYITIIGDSAVDASYIPWVNGWAGNIKKLTKKPALALGMGNNGPLLELATLKEYAQKIKPKIILWIYVEENDLVELKQEMKSSILSKYLDKNYTQNLIENQNLIEENYYIFLNSKIKENEADPTNALSVEKKKYNFISYIKLINLRYFLFNNLQLQLRYTITKKDLLNFEKIILEAKETTEKFRGKLYFVYLPATTRFFDFKNPLKKKDYYRHEVLKIVSDLQVPLIDLWELYFKNLDDPLNTLSFRMHSHYNKETIENASKIIVGYLEKNNLGNN